MFQGSTQVPLLGGGVALYFGKFIALKPMSGSGVFGSSVSYTSSSGSSLFGTSVSYTSSSGSSLFGTSVSHTSSSGSSLFGTSVSHTSSSGSSLFGTSVSYSPVSYDSTLVLPHCCFCHSTVYHQAKEILCKKCIEEARSIVALARELGVDGEGTDRPFEDVISRINGMKVTATDVAKKMDFLGGSLLAFKEQIPTDIQLKPGYGPCKPAHRALLAAKSEIFKNILDSDGFKALPTPSDAITLAELTTEELESLLEFLYFGSLPMEKLEKHAFALFPTAHKYEISYLLEICERHMLASLNSTNAFDILEIADSCSHKLLKDASLSFILKNMEEVVFSEKYESFVVKNPSLCIQITRKFVKKNKN